MNNQETINNIKKHLRNYAEAKAIFSQPGTLGGEAVTEMEGLIAQELAIFSLVSEDALNVTKTLFIETDLVDSSLHHQYLEIRAHPEKLIEQVNAYPNTITQDISHAGGLPGQKHHQAFSV